MHSSELTTRAILAALEAGELLRKGFGSLFEIENKPGKHNLVTAYDKKSEDMIVRSIRSQFPNHSFLAEESGSSNNHSSVMWIIDPLDGTVNFAHDIPIFTISIAAAVDHVVSSAVVYQPMTNELFIAELGQGAYLNGKRLKVTEETDPEGAVMATGFPYNVHEDPLQCIETFSAMTRLGIPIRRLGSAALDLAYVAAGRFDVYWEVSLHPWDMAAGKLLVEEAGGKVTHYDGSQHNVFSNDTILATNGHLHSAMIKQLESGTK